jgi:hypothetical protein
MDEAPPLVRSWGYSEDSECFDGRTLELNDEQWAVAEPLLRPAKMLLATAI